MLRYFGDMAQISTIGFDADDTLWHNMKFYDLTECRFVELLAEFAAPGHLAERLLAAEGKNLKMYGFGIKGFTLSMIETAIEVTEGKVPAPVIREILDAGRDMLSHPVETLPFAREALEALAGSHRLVLITKGAEIRRRAGTRRGRLGRVRTARDQLGARAPRRAGRRRALPADCGFERAGGGRAGDRVRRATA